MSEADEAKDMVFLWPGPPLSDRGELGSLANSSSMLAGSVGESRGGNPCGFMLGELGFFETESVGGGEVRGFFAG